MVFIAHGLGKWESKPEYFNIMLLKGTKSCCSKAENFLRACQSVICSHIRLLLTSIQVPGRPKLHRCSALEILLQWLDVPFICFGFTTCSSGPALRWAVFFVLTMNKHISNILMMVELHASS